MNTAPQPPDVQLLQAKDKLGHSGVLAYSSGNGERYIGWIGPFDDNARPLQGGIRVIFGKPNDGPPYIGIGFKIPRDQDIPWSFVDRLPGNMLFAHPSLRFHAGDFELHWKKLLPNEVDLIKRFFPQPAPEGKEILAIRFRMYEGKKPRAFQFSWPSYAAPGRDEEMFRELGKIYNAPQFTLFVEAGPLYFKKFSSLARTFAEFGRGTNLNQYLINNRVRYVFLSANTISTLLTRERSLQWDPKNLMKKCSDQASMAGYPDFFHAVRVFKDWNDLTLREGWATAFDHLWIEQFATRLRDTLIASQWVEDVPGKHDQYTVSLSIPNLGTNISTLFKVEDELEVCFKPKVDINLLGEKGERQVEPMGWKATVIERNSIVHSGTHLLKVWRHYDGAIPDPQRVSSYPVYRAGQTFQPIYLRLMESAKTVKARLNALNMMHPNAKHPSLPNPPKSMWENGEDAAEILAIEAESVYAASDMSAEDEKLTSPYVPKAFDSSNLRSIFIGMNVERLYDVNLLEGLSEGQIATLFKDLTPAQKIGLEAVLKQAPCGIVAMHGCAGAGKTITLCTALNAMLARGKKVIVASSTNQAVNNICVRFGEMEREEKYLKIRVHPEQFEFAEVWTYNPQKPSPTGWTATGNKKRFEKFGWEYSLASNLLKVAGCLPTTNFKLLEMQKDVELLGELLRTPLPERTDEDNKLLEQCTKICAEWLCDRADVVFATCITSTSKFLRKFRDEVDIVILDEVGCMTSTEAMIVWKGDTPCIMAGDPIQIGPPCMSANMRYKAANGANTGRRVNPFSEQCRLSPLERLRDIGWPHWVIGEQCRIEPGGFDLANYLFYSNLIRYHTNNVLTEGSILFEQWFISFSNEQQRLQRPNAQRTEVRGSAHTGIFPAMIAIKNAYTFREPRGTSKGNTQFLHFGLLSIRSFVEKTGCPTSKIGVLCPYLRQVRGWTEALSSFPELTGISVYTADSLQGWEKDYIWFDSTVSASAGASYSFVADQRRLCLMLTRHKKGLCILADPKISDAEHSNVVPEFVREQGMVRQEGDEGAVDTDVANQEQRAALKRMFGWMRAKGRILEVNSRDITQPLVDIITPEQIRREREQFAEEERRRQLALQQQGF